VDLVLFENEFCFTFLDLTNYLYMQTQVLNYRIIVTPDTQTGTSKPGYTALCPTLGVADDGDTIDEAIQNVKSAIQVFVDSLVEDGELVPVDTPERDIVTTAQINAPSSFRFA
jgi:predicted RNase H-like HicB family nuclease